VIEARDDAPFVGITHSPPRPAPSRVPSPGYAFLQPLTLVTIVI
jgi:hypothetical protein